MKTALCGTWHVHAEGYLKTALELTDVVGVWEENPEWQKALCEKYGLHAFASFEELLASDAEAVIVCTATNTHADYMTRFAAAKKDIFTEKVMTLTHEDALRVAEAVKENGVRFVISFPQKCRPEILAVKSVVDSGELGKLNYMRFRNCHSGSTAAWLPAHFYDPEACGGGAMIDLGAHGMYLTEWLMGMPEGYSSTFTLACPGGRNTAGVEDNAITVMRYANGAIAVNETGFVSCGSDEELEVGGDTGFIRWVGGEVIKRTKATGEKPVTVPVPEALPSPLVRFLKGEEVPDCGIKEAINLTDMMVGAYGK